MGDGWDLCRCGYFSDHLEHNERVDFLPNSSDIRNFLFRFDCNQHSNDKADKWSIARFVRVGSACRSVSSRGDSMKSHFVVLPTSRNISDLVLCAALPLA